jgi:valyl-tRNA synthetase
LSQVRRAKTDAKTSQKTAVTQATVSAPESVLAAFELGRGDLSDAGSVRSWVTVASAGETTVSAVLAPPEPAT